MWVHYLVQNFDIRNDLNENLKNNYRFTLTSSWFSIFFKMGGELFWGV